MVSVLLLLVVGTVVVLAGTGLARRGDRAGAPLAPRDAGQSVRRFFQYLLLLGLLAAAASGVAGLLGRGLEQLDATTVAPGGGTLALQLTFTTIALPLWLGLAWWTSRRAADDPRELASAGWAAYLTLAGLISLVVAVSAWTETLWMVTGVRDLRWTTLATAVVWTVVWAGHLGWGRRGTPRPSLLPRDLLSALVGLAVATYGLAALVGASLRALRGPEGTAFVDRGLDPLLHAGGLLAVGAAVWTVHWLLDLVRGPRTTGWLTLVLLAGVGGGLLLAVGALSVVLHQVLVWLLGDPRAGTAGEHFATTPGSLGVAVAGLVVWWYHQAVLDAGRARRRTEVRRVYEYVMAAVGLVAAAAGTVMVLVTLVEAVTAGRDLVVGEGAVNALLAALVLLAVGTPLWLWHWRLAQRARARDSAEELRSVSRRTYLLVLFGLTGVIAVGTLLVLVYTVLEDLLAGGLDAETLRSVRFPLGILLTASLVSGYHWTVFREDRREGDALAPPEAGAGPTPRRAVVVAALPPDELAEVASRSGVQVQQWTPLDGSAALTAEQVVAALDGAGTAPPPGGHLLVVAVGGAVHVIPVAAPR